MSGATDVTKPLTPFFHSFGSFVFSTHLFVQTKKLSRFVSFSYFLAVLLRIWIIVTILLSFDTFRPLFGRIGFSLGIVIGLYFVILGLFY